MMANGLTTNSMDMVLKLGLTGLNLKGSITWGPKMASVHIPGQTVASIKGIGKTIKLMER